MNNFTGKNKKWLIICAAFVVALISFFFLGEKFSDPRTYSEIIEVLDEKKANVLGLTASTTAASIAISAIPGDAGITIANQFADLGKYLLIILTVIYLEKYLLTIIGFIVFKALVPIVCLLLILNQFSPNNISLRSACLKIGLFSIALLLVIPTSVKISNMIDNTYQESINISLEELNNDISIDDNSSIEKSSNIEDNQDKKWYEKIVDKVGDVVDDVKNTIGSITSTVTDKLKNFLGRFIEATAVMIVTSCIIPILTIFAFLWLVKIILGVEVNKQNLIGMKDKVKAMPNIIDIKTKTKAKHKEDD